MGSGHQIVGCREWRMGEGGGSGQWKVASNGKWAVDSGKGEEQVGGAGQNIVRERDEGPTR